MVAQCFPGQGQVDMADCVTLNAIPRIKGKGVKLAGSLSGVFSVHCGVAAELSRLQTLPAPAACI